jgi:Cu/Ag efflux protein CusF
VRKKALSVALMSIISAAFATALLAEAPATKDAAAAPKKAQASVPEKKPVVERKVPGKKMPKGKTHLYTGNVTKMDTMLKTMAIRGRSDEMTFDVSGAQIKGDLKEGDKATVKYTKKDGKMVASSVTKAGEEKKKKEMSPGAKPVRAASAKK